MEYGIKNYMEDIIHDKMNAVLKSMPDICQCEKCRLDMLAFALNNSPPKYVVTAKGKLYTKVSSLEGQFNVDLVRIITDAVTRVGQKPRHNEEE
ncbi:MAG: late competence development ComFB family protein [Clostridiales bacterium]|jgi:competence protein ComFB|nr:late competence development ComFB family protein [Clostridiales bacterium]